MDQVNNNTSTNREEKSSGIGYRAWVMVLAGLFGAACASFLCALILGSFGTAFYGSIALGAAAGFVLAAVVYLASGKLRSSHFSRDIRAVVMLAAAGMFFAIGTIFLIASKDVKAPEIVFSDEIILMNEGDDEDVLFSNMTVTDDVDGDLLDQIEIISFEYLKDGESADVTYAVSDSSGNRTTAAQLAYVEGEPWPVR